MNVYVKKLINLGYDKKMLENLTKGELKRLINSHGTSRLTNKIGIIL